MHLGSPGHLNSPGQLIIAPLFLDPWLTFGFFVEGFGLWVVVCLGFRVVRVLRYSTSLVRGDSLLFPVLLGRGPVVTFGLEVVGFVVGMVTILGIVLDLGFGLGVATGLIFFSSSPFMQSDCPLRTHATGMHLRSLGQKKSLLFEQDVQVFAAWLKLQTNHVQICIILIFPDLRCHSIFNPSRMLGKICIDARRTSVKIVAKQPRRCDSNEDSLIIWK